MNTTELFIQSLWTVRDMELTPELIHAVKRCLLDYLGVTLAGSRLQGERGKVLLEALGPGIGECSVIGYARMSTLHSASFINGLSSHVAELDDGVISGIIHPGAPVFTALLAVAEKESVGFDNFCRGVLIGYESSVRLANAIQPSHKKRGYHASGTCGLIGATLGIAAMLGYTPKQVHDSFCAAVASVHGTLKVLEDDSELKPFNIATAASDGIVAALMGQAGFEGPADPLEGQAGFFAQFSEETDYSKLYRSEGESLHIFDVYVKPYAACRYVHPSIENALKLRLNHGIDVSQVVSIEIRTYALAVRNHDHTTVNNVSSAKMSIPFGAAVALITGSGGMGAFGEGMVRDADVSSLMKKISVVEDEECSLHFPAKSMAYMTVKMQDGTQYASLTEHPRGEASMPLSDTELIDKFKELCAFGDLSMEDTEHVVDNLFSADVNLHNILKIMRT
ncbi:MAG: MmgE/PrpD family protein [Muribaculaceae bacterium]|nr:MmgE/PrpD family protein [Muribaculaceae bacterium]